MPYSVEEDATTLRITANGAMTGEEFHKLVGVLSDLMVGRSHWPNNLVDLRAAEPSRLSFTDMLSLAKIREAVSPPNPIRSALVTSSPAMTGFARMFQSLNHNPSITIEVFSDVAAAERWLTAA